MRWCKSTFKQQLSYLLILCLLLPRFDFCHVTECYSKQQKEGREGKEGKEGKKREKDKKEQKERKERHAGFQARNAIRKCNKKMEKRPKKTNSTRRAMPTPRPPIGSSREYSECSKPGMQQMTSRALMETNRIVGKCIIMGLLEFCHSRAGAIPVSVKRQTCPK